MQPEPLAEHVAAIYNAAWFVRDLNRPHQRDKKAEAVTRLGFIVRAAFNSTEDFEPLLEAVANAFFERRYGTPGEPHRAPARPSDT